MTGRIRRRLIDAKLDARPAADGPVVCRLCDREIPPAQQDAHHLVPKSRGGRDTVPLHRICHRQIHALLDEGELARGYATLEALRAHPGLAAFVRWVQRKPDGFHERVRRSARSRGR